MNFEQRMGLESLPSPLAPDAMPDDLRNSLWNALSITVWDRPGFLYMPGVRKLGHNRVHGDHRTLMRSLWEGYVKRPLDEMPETPEARLKWIRDRFFKSEWVKVYRLIEEIVERLPAGHYDVEPTMNAVLARELAAYRMLNGKFVPITSDVELLALRESTTGVDGLDPVAAHMRNAVAFLSDKVSPDYRSAMREAITAVEAIARVLTNKSNATLGDAIKRLEGSNVELDPQFKQGLQNLYNYSNGPTGIRHAMSEAANVTVADAKFFVLICASFVNYLRAKI